MSHNRYDGEDSLIQFKTMAKEITQNTISDGSPQRVAFELMVFIGEREEHEDSSTEDSRKYREYWLTLYRQCRIATYPGRPASLSDVLYKEN
jgi:hypothetical protein